MVRLLAMVMLLTVQLVGAPLTALAACPMWTGGCGGERAATGAERLCCCQNDAATDDSRHTCPCCKGENDQPVRPAQPALPPTSKALTDLVPSDVPTAALTTEHAVAAFLPRTGGSAARPLANAKRVQAVLCRWRT